MTCERRATWDSFLSNLSAKPHDVWCPPVEDSHCTASWKELVSSHVNKVRRSDFAVDVSLELLSDINRVEHILSSTNTFKQAAVQAATQPHYDMQCSLILESLEFGHRHETPMRQQKSVATLKQLASRAAQLSIENPEAAGLEERPLWCLLDAVRTAVLHDHAIVLTRGQDRASLLLGSGLTARRMTPLSAALLYRYILSRCDPALETEVVNDENDCVRVWLRVSHEARDQHLLVNLSPEGGGCYVKLFPRMAKEKRVVRPNHWRCPRADDRTGPLPASRFYILRLLAQRFSVLALHSELRSVLRALISAQESMCACCANAHPTVDWFGDVCSHLYEELCEVP